MFNTVNEALDNAKRHGLSTSEILEGYRNEHMVVVTCDFCELPAVETLITDDEDYLNVFCSQECREKHADNRNEAAYINATTPRG